MASGRVRRGLRLTLRWVPESRLPQLRDVDADGNVYFCSRDPDWDPRHLATPREQGEDADGTFDLTISVPDEDAPRVFRGLTCDPAMRRMQWLGFVSVGQADAVTYGDDIAFGPVAQKP